MSLGLWEVVSWALGNVQVDGHGKGVTRDELAASVYRMEQARADIAERLANSQLTRALAAEAALAEEKDNREKFIAAESRYTDEARRERDDLRAKLAAAEAHNVTQSYDLDKAWEERDAALARVRELELARLDSAIGTEGVMAEECRQREWKEKAEARVAALEEALREVLETACSCDCEEIYTCRGLHATECHYDEVAHARRVLNGDKNCD